MIYLTSDLHGAFDIHKINPDEFIAGRSMSNQDYLIICGDFGCLWDGGSSDRFWLNWLESLPWNTLFIDGNHENFDVINSYPDVPYKGGTARQIRSNVFYLKRGEIYEIDDQKILSFGGAYSHDVAIREEGKNWWHVEVPDQAETDHLFENLEKHGHKVDLILTHDVFAAHPFARKYPTDFSRYPEGTPNLFETLQKVHDSTDYKAWFSGHYHQDALYQDGKGPCYTLYDNVMSLDEIKDHPDRFEKLN